MRINLLLQKYFKSARRSCWELYSRYYGNGSYKHHNERYRELVMENLRPNVCLLDAGCGAEMKIVGECAPKVRMAIGVDIERMDCSISNVQGVRSDLHNLPFKNESFDVIISMSVLEHVEHPEQVFDEFARLLRPGGVVVLQTPNKYDYVSAVARCTPFWFHKWLLSQIADRAEEDTFPTFFRANTERQIRSFLEQRGLSSVRVVLFNQYPAYLMFSTLLFRFGVLYERLTSRYEICAPLRGWILATATKRK